MATTGELFARVKGYHNTTTGGQNSAPGMGQYQGRLDSVRNAYWDRIQQERERNAQAWFSAAGGGRIPFGDLPNRVMGGGGGGGGRGRDAVDQFMAAISGQESGGNYNARNPDSGASGAFQIMPGNWAPWSRETFGRVVERTPANQNAVARHKMLQYFDQTGRWDLVARMWYAGPGSLNYSNYALNRPQGGGRYPSISDYVKSVMSRWR